MLPAGTRTRKVAISNSHLADSRIVFTSVSQNEKTCRLRPNMSKGPGEKAGVFGKLSLSNSHFFL